MSSNLLQDFWASWLKSLFNRKGVYSLENKKKRRKFSQNYFSCNNNQQDSNPQAIKILLHSSWNAKTLPQNLSLPRVHVGRKIHSGCQAFFSIQKWLQTSNRRRWWKELLYGMSRSTMTLDLICVEKIFLCKNQRKCEKEGR